MDELKKLFEEILNELNDWGGFCWQEGMMVESREELKSIIENYRNRFEVILEKIKD